MCCFMFAAVAFPYKGVWDSSEIAMRHFLYLCALNQKVEEGLLNLNTLQHATKSNSCFSMCLWSWFQVDGGFL